MSRCRSSRSAARCGSGAPSIPCCSSGCCGPRAEGVDMAWALPQGGVLGIFGRRPDPGQVQPRLAAEFGAELAAGMHEAMLFDLLETWDSERVLAPGGRRVLVFAPDDAGPWFDARVPASFALQPQADGDLGRRMHEFCAGEFAEGATAVVVIDSHAPSLDPSLVVS